LSPEDAIKKRNDEAGKIQQFQALKSDCLERVRFEFPAQLILTTC
jgi:hypothetical protein